MNYENVTRATFIERENRFVARVRLTGGEEVGVHVKNTGRCRELLISGATVYLEDHADSTKNKVKDRKYRYSLIAVEKGPILINMDSQAPNRVVREALDKGAVKLFGSEDKGEDGEGGRLSGDLLIRPETAFGSSRFDFCVESASRRAFVEVKGVTLEEDGIARFPDAPTERGIKHIRELEQAVVEGYEAHVIFVVQMKGIRCFEPNDVTHPEFGEALHHAKAMGVTVSAYDCIVTPDTLELDQPVEIRL